MAVIFDEVTADVQSAQREAPAPPPNEQGGKPLKPEDIIREFERKTERAMRLHAD